MTVGALGVQCAPHRYVGYDLLDRARSRTQTVSYQHTATYKPAGLWTETYHSGRVITYGRDAVGRVTGVSGVKGGQARTYLSSASYAPHGAPSSLSFGNGQTETWTWNYRLQPASIARGSALSLTYYYCPSQGTVCATNNGSMVSQTIGHVGVAQTYGYDARGRTLSVTPPGNSGSTTWLTPAHITCPPKKSEPAALPPSCRSHQSSTAKSIT